MDDEIDEFDARIIKTGCFKEHEAMFECHYTTKDFRKCAQELLAFKKCFNKQSLE